MSSFEDKIINLIYESMKKGFIKETSTGKAIDKKVIYEKFKGIGINKAKANELLIDFNITELADGKPVKLVNVKGKKKRCIVVADEFINKNKLVF
jgi:hypothetical protein